MASFVKQEWKFDEKNTKDNLKRTPSQGHSLSEKKYGSN